MQNAKKYTQGDGEPAGSELGAGEKTAQGHVDNMGKQMSDKREIKNQKRSLLLVEDCPFTRRVHRAFLDESKYNIDVTEDGMAALKKYRSNNYDLIILDMELPKLSGLSVCRKIRQRLLDRTTPIIMVSTHQEIELLCLQYGANVFLPKPVEAMELAGMVESLLSKRH